MYKIDRRKFIDYCLADKDDIILVTTNIKKHLKDGGEFIVTATELLDQCHSIPTGILDNYKGSDEYVKGSECELIYKHPFE